MSVTLDKEREGVGRHNQSVLQQTYAIFTDEDGWAVTYPVVYDNLVAWVRDVLSHCPVKKITVVLPFGSTPNGGGFATFIGTAAGIQWVEADLILPWQEKEINPFDHIDYVLEDNFIQRRRDGWLGEVWR